MLLFENKRPDNYEAIKAICTNHLCDAINQMRQGEPFEAWMEFGSFRAVVSLYYASTGDTTLMPSSPRFDPELCRLYEKLLLTEWKGIPFNLLDNDTLESLIREGEHSWQ